MELTPEVQRICQREASKVWDRARLGTWSSFDFHDLHQQALIIAWQVDEMPINHLVHLLRWRLVDWMRATNPLDKSLRLEALDGDSEYMERNHLIDPAFREVETRLTVQWLLEDDLGDPRGRAVAWLHANGVTLPEIGDHLGFTEGRAAQIRRRYLKRARERLEGGGVTAA